MAGSLSSSRELWRWRGAERPPWAEVPRPDQESVWDYPRPPRLAPDTREVLVCWGSRVVARSHRAIRVLETAHPPSFYLPWADVVRECFQPAAGTSVCEWKGPAAYWSLVDGSARLDRIAWSYPDPLPAARALADCVSFYPKELDCFVGGAAVTPQPGGFYGGWITPDLAGPFKGGAGTQGW